jgi:methylthioribose-1-phosphate isomerase
MSHVINDEVDFERFDKVRALDFDGTALQVLDQRLLPHRKVWIACSSSAAVGEAIANLSVRGAPAIGIAASFGVLLAAIESQRAPTCEAQSLFDLRCASLRAARPTAVNLMWAVDRMRALATRDVQRLELEARSIQAQDLAWNRQMGLHGAALIAPGSGVLTHCNTGSLATAGFGTALGVIRTAFAQGKLNAIFASETRPWLQGSRLTAWELLQDQIPAKLIADGAGAYLMQQGLVQWLIVGADRICANGDVANKIGTCAHAAAAKIFGAKVMVVAPSSTVDLQTASGADIHIEERDPAELLSCAGTRIAADGVSAFNPVFDITPARLIDAIVTERGVIHAPNLARMRVLAG